MSEDAQELCMALGDLERAFTDEFHTRAKVHVTTSLGSFTIEWMRWSSGAGWCLTVVSDAASNSKDREMLRDVALTVRAAVAEDHVALLELVRILVNQERLLTAGVKMATLEYSRLAVIVGGDEFRRGRGES